jgi:hypothetical protein
MGYVLANNQVIAGDGEKNGTPAKDPAATPKKRKSLTKKAAADGEGRPKKKTKKAKAVEENAKSAQPASDEDAELASKKEEETEDV